MSADFPFGQWDAALDLVAVYRAIIPAIGTARAIVAEDKILTFAKDENTGKPGRKGIDLFRQVRLDQHFAVYKDITMLDVDEFAGQSDDAFNRTFLIAVVEDHDVAPLQRRRNGRGVNPSARFVGREHAGAADHRNRADKRMGDGNPNEGGSKNGKKHPECGSLPEVFSKEAQLSHF